jgi:hypothetical protein
MISENANKSLSGYSKILKNPDCQRKKIDDGSSVLYRDGQFWLHCGIFNTTEASKGKTREITATVSDKKTAYFAKDTKGYI